MINSQPKVSVIIVNYNGTKDTLECLKSLEKLLYENYEIIIVDNNSIESEKKLLETIMGQTKISLIFNNSNKGFAGGNNVGIQKAVENNAEFILLLNNDTIVKPNFLTELINKCSVSSQIGILTPKILYYSNPDLIWSAGGNISKIRSSGFPSCYEKKSDSCNSDKFCSFATGCCMLIRKEVINKIGLLDENYFLYLEDTDYSVRAIKAGFKIYYVSSSVIYHKVNAATAKDNYYLPLYYSIRNRLYFARNHLRFYYYTFLFYLLITLVIKIIFSNNKNNLFHICKMAIIDFLKDRMGYCLNLESPNSK